MERVMFKLEVDLPGLPRTTNAARASGHWDRYKHDVSWKTQVAHAVRGKLPPAPLVKFRLELTRWSSVEPDYDNLTSTFKVIVDGLKYAGVIANDKISNTGQWDCRWEKTKPKQGRIRVVVEERE